MQRRTRTLLLLALAAVTIVAMAVPVAAAKKNPAMVQTIDQWDATAVFTVGEKIKSYQPAGILDGIGVWDRGSKAQVLVNHELNPGVGYAYELANGTELRGARVSTFDIRKSDYRILDAGLAFDTVYDRAGAEVTTAAQVNELDGVCDDTSSSAYDVCLENFDNNPEDGAINDAEYSAYEVAVASWGFARFCSAVGYDAGDSWHGFVDDIYFTGEETTKNFHPHEGTEWALDVASGDLWALPELGRGAWENVTAIDTGDPDTVGLVMGDDEEKAPLYLWIGTKVPGDFPDVNGLTEGQLYVWVAEFGEDSPQDFNGTGNILTGTFQPIEVRDISMAGQDGYDAAGYKDGDVLRAEAIDDGGLNAFSFSRPEDLASNPADRSQVAFASTGRGGVYPADNWGTVYVVDIDTTSGLDPSSTSIDAELAIVHDADDADKQDFGIRSADNLDWSDDGFIYVQEDRSTSPSSLFGATSGREASILMLNPETLQYGMIAEVDRSMVLPANATDGDPDDLGDWETSGVLDVSEIFGTDETLLIATVQAHSIRDGKIAQGDLVEGGQLIMLARR